ncbi:MAG: hydroxyethylthiazole kinase [Lachnospiraceae bacterium]|nr:hydroxyethylthiazole kinase [Lachnospiraceae bacterium]
MFADLLKQVRETQPLIHNITNYVTVNDCANIVIACGASPIMADDPAEVAEVTTICAGLTINIGTLNSRTVESMCLAGKTANALHHPVVFDPVGVGVSALRMETAKRLLREVKCSVIRGNITEIKTLDRLIGGLGVPGRIRGVDASAPDAITEETLESGIAFVKAFAQKAGAVVVITGAIDLVSDGARTYVIYNGRKEMASVTGTGCQLSAMTSAFVAANPNQILDAAAAAVCAMGLAGEIAYRRMSKEDGNASYRNYIIDAIYRMSPQELAKGARYEMR